MKPHLLLIDKQGQRCRCSFLIGVFIGVFFSVTRMVGLFRFARLAAGFVERLLHQTVDSRGGRMGQMSEGDGWGSETRIAPAGSQPLIAHPKLFEHRLPNKGVGGAAGQIIALVPAFIRALLGLC